MNKTILITGSTDGIGLEAAKMLHNLGHTVLLHGRNAQKLQEAQRQIGAELETYVADLSKLDDVEKLADAIANNHKVLDVLINNAGVYRSSNHLTEEGLDARYVVNTIAPYLLTQKLLPTLDAKGRVVNLSSAAQAAVNTQAFFGEEHVYDGQAYAESKLALTMWTNALAQKHKNSSQVFVSVNPRSMLGTKMVKEAYGVNGSDVRIGADILTRAATSQDFADASGKYFDNDIGRFASPHPDALNAAKCDHVVSAIETALKGRL